MLIAGEVFLIGINQGKEDTWSGGNNITPNIGCMLPSLFVVLTGMFDILQRSVRRVVLCI